MLNIKTIKKLLMLAVALVMLFTAAFFCCNTNLAALAQGEPTAEEVDDYLRDNGYSEEFIAQAGQETKLNLYENSAVYVEDIPVIMGNDIVPLSDEIIGEEYDVTHIENWGWLEAWLTVSDVSNESENKTRKIITMTCDYDTTDNLDHQAIAFTWMTNYWARYETALFEVSGTGTKVGVHMPPQIHYDNSPQTINGSLLVKRGLEAVYLDTTTQNQGVGYKFSISYFERHKVDFGTDYYAEYTFVPGTLGLSYSITIEGVADPEHSEQNMVVANYFYLENYFNIDFDFSFGLSPSLKPPYIILVPSINISFEAGSEYQMSSTLQKRFYEYE